MTGFRIIAGNWKGRRLRTPPGLATRPLLDRIKQSIFDILGQDLTNWRVADCCAGSGSFGIEAASRGASEVHLIECGNEAADTIDANLQTLSWPDGVTLHRRTVEEVLPTLRDLDLIFFDPPFPWYREDPGRIKKFINLGTKALADDGLLLIRGEHGYNLPPLGAELHMKSTHDYGRSWVVVFEPRQ